MEVTEDYTQGWSGENVCVRRCVSIWTPDFAILIGNSSWLNPDLYLHTHTHSAGRPLHSPCCITASWQRLCQRLGEWLLSSLSHKLYVFLCIALVQPSASVLYWHITAAVWVIGDHLQRVDDLQTSPVGSRICPIRPSLNSRVFVGCRS